MPNRLHDEGFRAFRFPVWEVAQLQFNVFVTMVLEELGNAGFADAEAHEAHGDLSSPFLTHLGATS